MTARERAGAQRPRARTAPGGERTRSFNLVLAGVGGQGILLTGRLVCQAAMEQGYAVNAFESHGMAQRGGAVYSHVRWGSMVRSSLILDGQADLVVALEPVESLRQLRLLSPRTTAVVNIRTIVPISVSSVRGSRYPDASSAVASLASHVGEVLALDGSAIAEGLGNPMLLSTVMTGAAWASGRLPLERELLRQAVREIVPPRYLEANLEAFELGQKAVAAAAAGR